MPRYNVEADGKWACFSSVPDEFITPFMPREEYEKWREEQYGAENVPIEQANQKTLAQALFSLSVIHSDEQICDNLRAAGLLAEKWEDRELTNYEHLQTLEHYKLATAILNIGEDPCKVCPRDREDRCNEDCNNGLVEWLTAPYDPSDPVWIEC